MKRIEVSPGTFAFEIIPGKTPTYFCDRCSETYDRCACDSNPQSVTKWKSHDSPSHYIEIAGKECTITIEERPHYCDRGNFLAKLHPSGKLALEIDSADGWPRYYFDLDRAKAEVEAWLQKRGQTLE